MNLIMEFPLLRFSWGVSLLTSFASSHANARALSIPLVSLKPESEAVPSGPHRTGGIPLFVFIRAHSWFKSFSIIGSDKVTKASSTCCFRPRMGTNEHGFFWCPNVKIKPFVPSFVLSLRWITLLPAILVCHASTITAQVSTQPTISAPDSAGIVKLEFPPTPAIERADLNFRAPISECSSAYEPKGILILVPGRNGNGRDLIIRDEWTHFADTHHLALCGLSFSSPKDRIEDSYSNAHSGSGDLLLAGLTQFLGQEKAQTLPLLIYGFSAGARFTASFVDAHPDRVRSWCGYAVGRWEEIKSTAASFPPGIVACGEWDAGCYHASLLHFQRGRKLGQPWMWLSLAETGHQWSPVLDDYVCRFFTGMLDDITRNQWVKEGGYFDIDTRKAVSENELKEWPIFATWLPGGELHDLWMEVHHP